MRYALFDTEIGCCALAWGQAGISNVWLPEVDREATRREVLRTQPGAAETPPPPAVQRVVDGVVALLAGEPDDGTLAAAELDLTGLPAFHPEVYRVTRSIEPGRLLSYGQIASRLGAPGAARAVGRALGDNPCPIVVPCHRVVAANGALHGFSAPGGLATKRRMLQIEGALAADEPTLF